MYLSQCISVCLGNRFKILSSEVFNFHSVVKIFDSNSFNYTRPTRCWTTWSLFTFVFKLRFKFYFWTIKIEVSSYSASMKTRLYILGLLFFHVIEKKIIKDLHCVHYLTAEFWTKLVAWPARSTDRNKLTASQRFRRSDSITDFVAVISSQSEDSGKITLGIVKYAYGRSPQLIGVIWFAVSCRGPVAW